MKTLSPSQFAQRAAGVARNTEPGSASGCFICQQKLFVQFFFDGFGHSVDDDEAAGLMSNVGKLYRIAVAAPQNGIDRVYVDGPGTKLKSRVEVRRTMGARAAGEAAIAPANLGSELAIGAAERAAEGRNPLRALSPSGLKSGLVGAFVEGLLGWAAEVSPVTRDAKALAFLSQTGYDARLSYAHDRLATIVKTQTLRVTEIHIAVYGADRGATLARAFVNQLIKANSRKDRSDPEAVHYPTPTGPARLFFRFMGLFDATSSLGKLTGLGMPMLRNDAGDVFDLKVPPQVESCVHLAAAHEFRHVMPLHTTASTSRDAGAWLEEQAKKAKARADAARAMKQALNANAWTGGNLTGGDHEAEARRAEWSAIELRTRALRLRESGGFRVEKLYAGAQPNVVGGGFKDGEGGKSAELSKLPLIEMRKHAFLNGCPLLNEQEISGRADLAALFELRPIFQLANGKNVAVDELHRDYLGGKSVEVSPANLETHTVTYMHWLHQRLLALDRMPAPQRQQIHEQQQNIPLTALGKGEEIKGNPRKFRMPLPVSPVERRMYQAFDQGADLSEACRLLFDQCVYTPPMPSYFAPRAIDVTED